LIFPAQKSGGQVDLYTDSMVSEVTLDENGKANGVKYINKKDRQQYEISAKIVILAASACSSARILLNSKSEKYPNGFCTGVDEQKKI